MSAALAQAPDASVQEQARDQEARRLFEAGRAAYVDEKYQDALNYFQQAHDLSRRPQLLYNIGQAADRLERREEAAQAFRQYLAEVPDASNRGEVEARIVELEAQPTVVTADAPASEANPEQTLPASAGHGLYLRGGLGLGLFADSFNRNMGAASNKASGASLAGEIAVGFALVPGLALAGTLALEGTQATIDTGKTGKVGPLLTLGGLVDFYLAVNGGLHLQGGFGISAMKVSAGDSGVLEHSPVGGSLFGGVGYEWHVRDKLWIGVLGRATLAQLKANDYTHNVLALSVLATGTIF